MCFAGVDFPGKKEEGLNLKRLPYSRLKKKVRGKKLRFMKDTGRERRRRGEVHKRDR